MLRSFQELSKREEQLSGLVREIFGEGSVGLFGIGLSPSKTQRLDGSDLDGVQFETVRVCMR